MWVEEETHDLYGVDKTVQIGENVGSRSIITYFLGTLVIIVQVGYFSIKPVSMFF